MTTIYKRLLYLSLLGLLLASCGSSTVVSQSNGKVNIDNRKRSFGTYIDDRQVIEVLETNLDNAEEFAKSNINVYSFNRVVLLTGEVASRRLKERATMIADEVHSVRFVHNELQIRPNASFMSRANDNWLHNKIKSKLASDENIDVDRVEVIVENEVVYLMGLLNRDEVSRITEIVRMTGGVRKVVRAIEYID